MAIVISNKLYFQPKSIKKDKEGHFYSLQGNFVRRNSQSLTYAPNTKAPIFIKETLLKLKKYIAPPTIIGGAFNSPLSPVDSSWKQKMNKDTAKLAENMYQLELKDIYKTYHPKTKEYTLLSTSQHLVKN